MRVKPRRRRRSLAARMRPFWMPIGAGTALVVVGLALAATWPGFRPTRIAVVGNQRVSRGEILARAGIAPHLSIWLENTGAIAGRIAAIPFIATATVHRIPPATLTIVVTERAVFATLRSGANAAVVDRALRVLESASDDQVRPVLVVAPGLDLLPGEFVRTRPAVELRDAYETMSARRIVPVEVGFDRFGGLVVTMDGGLRLLLGGQSDLGQKLTLADAILSQVVGSQRRVAAIDLRAPATPVLVYR
jgi:cell division protein FtsQ